MKKVKGSIREEVSKIVKQQLGNFENKLVDELVKYVGLFEGGERTRLLQLRETLKEVGKEMASHPEELPPEMEKESKEIEKIHKIRMGSKVGKDDEKIKRRIESKFRSNSLKLKPWKRHEIKHD